MIRKSRWFYAGWFCLISGAIVLQLYLAGYGVFGAGSFGPHLLVGDMIGLAILVGIGLAFAARAPWRITGINVILLVLMVVQASLAHAGVKGIAALHVVNGVLIFGLTIYMTRELLGLARQERAEAPVG